MFCTFMSSMKEGNPPIDMNVKKPPTYAMHPALPCESTANTTTISCMLDTTREKEPEKKRLHEVSPTFNRKDEEHVTIFCILCIWYCHMFYLDWFLGVFLG